MSDQLAGHSPATISTPRPTSDLAADPSMAPTLQHDTRTEVVEDDNETVEHITYKDNRCTVKHFRSEPEQSLPALHQGVSSDVSPPTEATHSSAADTVSTTPINQHSQTRQSRSRRLRSAITRPVKRAFRAVKRTVLSCTNGRHTVDRDPENSASPLPTTKSSKPSDARTQELPTSQAKDIKAQNGVQEQQVSPKQDDAPPSEETLVHSEKATHVPSTTKDVVAPANLPAPTVANAHTETSASTSVRKQDPQMPPELLKEYDVTTRVLGVGTFAEVKEIKRKDDGKSFALKIILKKALQGKAAMMDTEIAVLSQVRHPNCVSLLAKFEDEHAYYLVTEMAEGGELFDQLLKKGHYTERDAARLIHEVLLGVEYLHSVGIVHRDLKPENLLFMDKTENSRLVITDFGLSKILTNGNHVLMTACGTPGYVAPEVLEQIGHGKPVDLWSTGVIAYTLLCGYTPFWGEDQPTLFENIIAGQYEYEDEYWKYISDEAKSFIDTLLVRPAERRTTATQALAHPWLSMMLEQGVNLAPGVRQNISAVNAKRAFRKTVQAVSVVRRLQAAGRMHAAARMQATVPSITSSERPNGEARANTTVSQAYDDVRGDSPEPSQPKPTSLGFRDVINMAVSANQDGKVPDASLDQTN